MAMMAKPMTDAEIETMAETLRVLGHGVRLRLLETLSMRGEMAVGELEMVTGVGQPGLSQQLAILRKAEMVNTRRAAKQVYYSLTADALKAAAQLVGRLAGLSAQAVAPRAARSAKRGSAVVFPKIL